MFESFKKNILNRKGEEKKEPFINPETGVVMSAEEYKEYIERKGDREQK